MKLLRLYPAAWRARYGDELASLIEELEGGKRTRWRLRLDVARAGVLERARALVPHGLPPEERTREGSLLVLYAWVVFAIGGFGVQKASEHWEAVTPAARQALPAAAFDVLVLGAAIGSALVLGGVALALPRLAGLLRAGGWAGIRGPVLRAAWLTLLAIAATVGLAAWAHSLPAANRNGHDAAYSVVFVGWVLLLAGSLLAWAAAAAATARRLSWSATALRLEAVLGAAVSVAMAVMTGATALWWGSVARAAPWFFDGRPAGRAGSAAVANMIVPAALMLGATVLAFVGAARALKAVPSLSGPPRG